MAPKKKTKTVSWRARVFLICGLITAAVFLPTTFLILVGMIPTPFALFVDRTQRKNKFIAVGAMNLAGCAPFVFELWLGGNDFEKSFEIVSNLQAIMVMWSAAAVGYLVNWSVTGIVSAFLHQRGQARQKSILKRQQELIDRWGREVTGEIPLDEEGFAVETESPKDPKGDSYQRRAR